MSLTNFDEVRKYVNQHSEDDINQDQIEVIQDLCIKMSKVFESYCGTYLEQTTVTEYLDGFGGDMLFPSYSPIISITSINEDMGREWTGDNIDSDDYFLNDDIVLFKSRALLDYPSTYKIVYEAGYATIPEDLKLACIKEVLRIYKNDYMSGNIGITKANPQGQGMDLQYWTNAFMNDTITTLNNYTPKAIW